MRRRRLLGLLSGLTASLAGVTLAHRLPEALVEMESFRVTGVELEGARRLVLSEAVAAAGRPARASVWDDFTAWEAGLRGHPLVRSARIRRRLPGTLVFVIEEREPVALLSTPTLEPVDEEGRVLPLDPATDAVDLPLLRVDLTDPPRIRILTGELARLGRVEPAFLGEVSEVGTDERGDVVARWGVPLVTFRFRPSVPPRRLREGVRALADATGRQEGKPPVGVDLRWADQVVVRVK